MWYLLLEGILCSCCGPNKLWTQAKHLVIGIRNGILSCSDVTRAFGVPGHTMTSWCHARSWCYYANVCNNLPSGSPWSTNAHSVPDQAGSTDWMQRVRALSGGFPSGETTSPLSSQLGHFPQLAVKDRCTLQQLPHGGAARPHAQYKDFALQLIG